MWTACEEFKQTWKSVECTCLYGLAVHLQSAWTHQTCSLFVHRPCQIYPVQHSQFLLNWVKDSEISLYWVYGWGATADTVRQDSKGAPSDNFLEVLGWKDARGITNFSSRKLWAFIPTKPKRCGKSWHFKKIYNCLALARASLAEGLESINLIFSKSLTFRPPFPNKSLFWLL